MYGGQHLTSYLIRTSLMSEVKQAHVPREKGEIIQNDCSRKYVLAILN